MWIFLQKFVFFYLLVIWFCTCKDWWNKAILVPIGMILYQIINLLNDEMKFKDTALDAIVIIPVILIIYIILIKFRFKMLYYIDALNLNDEIDREINKIKKTIDD